jgi:hypothetical protein
MLKEIPNSVTLLFQFDREREKHFHLEAIVKWKLVENDDGEEYGK